jgi:pimeloyl-ACP methyl ester carboxylesterase
LTSPAETGPYAVARVRVETTNPDTGHRLKADLYHPALDEALDPRGAPYPALVFAHGFLAWPLVHTGNGRHLASWGYVVAILDFPDEHTELRASDTGHLFSSLEVLNADEGSRFFEQIDARRFGLVGHSLGGLTTLMVAARDVRVKAAVALDPVRPPSVWRKGSWDYRTEAPGLTAPLAVIAAPAHRCNLFAAYRKLYAAVGSGHKAQYVLPHGSHCDYMDVPSSRRFIVDTCSRLCGRPFSEERMCLIERYTAAWFNYYLKGDTEGYDHIFGSRFSADAEAERIVAEIDTAPGGFKAEVAGSEVHLTWNVYDVPPVAGYHIYRRETEGQFGEQPLASVGRLGTYRDATAVRGHTYFYALASYDPAGQEHGRSFAGPVTILLQE